MAWGLDSMTNYQPRTLIGTAIVVAMLAPSRLAAQAPATPPAQSLATSPTDARAVATNDLLRRAQTAVASKDYLVAVELYRRAKANAQAMPALQGNVQALRQTLTSLGFDTALLDLPPSAPPALPATPIPATAPAVDQAVALPPLRPIPLGANSLPASDLASRKTASLQWLAAGRAALDRGDIALAQKFAMQADALAVPESAFVDGEPRVWQLTLDVDSAARRLGSKPLGAIQQVGGVMAAGDIALPGGVVQSIFNSSSDTTTVQQVQAQAALPVMPLVGGEGEKLYREGLEALSSGNSARARELFVEAWKHEKSMDLATRNQLKEKLTLMQIGRLPATDTGKDAPPLTNIQKADLEAKAENLKVYREVTAELATVNEMKSAKPIEALDRLERLRRKVSDSKLDTAAISSMLTMVDRAISEQKQYVEANRGQIDLDLANAAVEAEMASDATNKQRIDEEISSLVETYNDLMDQRRFPEAEVVAKKVSALSPGSSIAVSMFTASRQGTRLQINQDIRDEKEDNINKVFLSVDAAGIPMDPGRDIQFSDAKVWGDLTRRRSESRDTNKRLSTAEKEIQRRLDTPVDINYNSRQLGEVMQDLAAVTNIPIVMDSRAMEELRVNSDSPVTLDLPKAIPLKSALNLILGKYELTYVIQNDVLNITSIEAKRSMVYPWTYRVAELVTPIPNFSSSYEDGLAGALRAAQQGIRAQADVQIMPVSAMGMANRGASNGAAQSMNPSMMAQYHPMGSQGGFGVGGPAVGGRGGQSLADFGPLMELIQTTVVPDTWETLGGPSTMSPYIQNNSLVISTTSEVHDQIAELLASLRRLQNLQITIEVRFITLSDQFFENMGIDFDVSIDDHVNQLPDDDSGPSTVVGFNGTTPTADFDIKLSNNLTAVPTLGAFDPAAGATIGFAILSDIEAFFFLQAAQGDSRNNVMQAPKVTLFDGQLASIQDQTQRPFVTSITPVVGDFAVAQQPVIVVLNEGTQLNVQAIVSDDKRYVRLTLVPFFSQIGDVNTFTYEGRRRRTTSNQTRDPATGEIIDDDEESDIVEGTTVQLPTFAFTSVSTTVSVPDGGTILLGGIKRLSEARLERGVPVLSKIPYVSRLFRNVAISRDARSLMLMVTPRIIIEEEEELAQTGFEANR